MAAHVANFNAVEVPGQWNVHGDRGEWQCWVDIALCDLGTGCMQYGGTVRCIRPDGGAGWKAFTQRRVEGASDQDACEAAKHL